MASRGRGAFGDVEDVELATSGGFGSGLFVGIMDRLEAVDVELDYVRTDVVKECISKAW